jgi:hypothetical protein
MPPESHEPRKSSEDNKVSANELVILAGGVELTVERLDGQRETVKVRQLPLRLMAAYGNAQGDEGALCELFADRPEGWADALKLESAEALVELGDQLNLTPFFRWARRRTAAGERLAPLTQNLPGSAKSPPPFAPAAGTDPRK